MRKVLLATVFSFVVATSVMANPVQVNHGDGPTNQSQVYGDGSAAQSQQSFTKSVAGAASKATVGNVDGSSHNKLNNTVNINGVGNGSGDNGYRDLPVSSAIAPSFGGGMNGCSGTAASLGGQFQLFGLSAGGTDMDEVCRAMRLGEMDVAREVECTDSHSFRNAAYRIGRPCMVDRERFEQEHPHVIQASTQVVAPVTPVSSKLVMPNKHVHDYNKTATECTDLDRKYNAALCK